MTHEPTTLGELLERPENGTSGPGFGGWLRVAFSAALNVLCLVTIIALLAWYVLVRPEVELGAMLIVLAVLGMLWLLTRPGSALARARAAAPHDLLADDRQRVLRDLRLDAKTALFDGNNIYHLGHAKGLDAQPLGEIVDQLRAEEYRIVCIFDANIFFTLQEHGAFPARHRHSTTLLRDIFGLAADEIYVVPSGEQADRYILEVLNHLPISFAVTNDQFRDYAAQYPAVMKDSQWRKGVKISHGRPRLLRHHTPVAAE